MKWAIYCFISLFLISVVSAIPLYVKPLTGTALNPSSTFEYEFNFTTVSDCSGVVLSNKSNITTGVDGVGFF